MSAKGMFALREAVKLIATFGPIATVNFHGIPMYVCFFAGVGWGSAVNFLMDAFWSVEK